MSEINKVSPSAGAEWLLGGFRLLARSPLGFGGLGAIFGVFGLLPALAGQQGWQQGSMVLQLAFMLIGPLLLAGLIYAAHEIDHGRGATPGHLLSGIREGKAARLIGTLIPQFVALLLLGVLLVVMIGPTGFQEMMQIFEKLQGQTNPDPALVAQLPLGRLMLWLLLVLVVGVVAGFFTFTAVPDMLFADVGLFAAMRRSLRACLRNIGAMLVFFVLVFVAAFALNIAAAILGFVAKLIAGELAMLVIVQLAMMAVLMPALTGAMYFAWKQMLGAPAQPAPGAAPGGIEA